MSGAKDSRGTVSRRGFLKTSGAAVGALGLAGAAGMLSTSGWLAPASAESGNDERVAYTFHKDHCGGMCPLKCTVREGRLVKIEPNDNVQTDRQRTICLKGISEIQHVYSDHRVQTPLKRVGERGTHDFESITWDQALQEIADKLTEIRDRDGNDAVLVTATSEAKVNPHFLTDALCAQTRFNNDGIDVGNGNGFDPAIGFGGGFATATGEQTEWVNSKLLLNVGCNYLETSLPNAHAFFDAKEAGCKVVTVDPHFSTTACKSDKWLAIRPGTDAAFFLGMATYIMDNGLMDEDFVRNHTSYPFLVNAQTGMLLRDHEEDPDAEEPETGAQNPFFVIGPDGAPAAYDAVENPPLSGTVERDGVAYRTVYDLAVENQKGCTLEWASEITGIPAADIAEVAELYAAGPACLSLGWGGNDKMSNADIAGHAAALNVALTGNIGKVGAQAGIFIGGSFVAKTATLGAWELPEEYAAFDTDMETYEMRTEPNKVRALICCGDHIAQHNANMGKTTAWLDELELVVSIDPFFTEGAKWSDYVLPAVTRFEADDEYNNVRNGICQLMIQEKVLDPLFEAKTDLWIQRELLNRMGITGILPESASEYAQALLSGAEVPEIAALTCEQIHENGGVWPLPGVDEPRRLYLDRVFDTVSGRMDVYYENLVEYGQALPTWEPCLEAYDGNPLREQYPFQLSNVRTRFRIHNQFNDAAWIQEIFEHSAIVNPADLEGTDLAAGDTVEIYNERGSYKTRLRTSEAICPGSVRVVEAATDDFTQGGNLQNLTNDTTLERGEKLLCGPVVPFSDTLVGIRKA